MRKAKKQDYFPLTGIKQLPSEVQDWIENGDGEALVQYYCLSMATLCQRLIQGEILSDDQINRVNYEMTMEYRQLLDENLPENDTMRESLILDPIILSKRMKNRLIL